MGKRNLTFAVAGLSLALVSSLATPSFGQSRPVPVAPPTATAPQPAEQAAAPQIQSPYWNRAPDYVHSDVRQTPATPDDILGQSMAAVPVARAQWVVADMSFRRLNAKINRTADAIRRDFTESDDYVKATDNLKAALTDYENARARAIAGLKDTDEYRNAMSMFGNVSDQIAAEHDAEHPDPQRLLALAGLKMDTVAPLRAVEREQIEGSDEVRQARERVRTAAAEVDRLERGFSRDARKDQTLASLTDTYDDAKINRLAASAVYYESRVNRNIAVNYAYTSRLLDYGRNRFGYSPAADDLYGGSFYNYRFGGLNFGTPYTNYGGVGYFGGY